MGFAGVQQTVNPRQKLPRAVVGVEHDRNTVGLGESVDVVGGRDTPSTCARWLSSFRDLPA